MSLADYVANQEEKRMQGHEQEAVALKKSIFAGRVLQNIQNMWRFSDDELRARNMYGDERGNLWLEENDWVYGMLIKAIRYARNNLTGDKVDRVYENVRVLQRKIQMRKMRAEKYEELKGKSAESLTEEFGRE